MNSQQQQQLENPQQVTPYLQQIISPAQQGKPDVGIRNLFNKPTDSKLNNSSLENQENQNLNMEGSDGNDPGWRQESSRNSSSESDKEFIDENVRNAIELRQKKSKVTDFYLKLTELKDRIDREQQQALNQSQLTMASGKKDKKSSQKQQRSTIMAGIEAFIMNQLQKNNIQIDGERNTKLSTLPQTNKNKKLLQSQQTHSLKNLIDNITMDAQQNSNLKRTVTNTIQQSGYEYGSSQISRKMTQKSRRSPQEQTRNKNKIEIGNNVLELSAESDSVHNRSSQVNRSQIKSDSKKSQINQRHRSRNNGQSPIGIEIQRQNQSSQNVSQDSQQRNKQFFLNGSMLTSIDASASTRRKFVNHQDIKYAMKRQQKTLNQSVFQDVFEQYEKYNTKSLDRDKSVESSQQGKGKKEYSNLQTISKTSQQDNSKKRFVKLNKSVQKVYLADPNPSSQTKILPKYDVNRSTEKIAQAYNKFRETPISLTAKANMKNFNFDNRFPGVKSNLPTLAGSVVISSHDDYKDIYTKERSNLPEILSKRNSHQPFQQKNPFGHTVYQGGSSTRANIVSRNHYNNLHISAEKKKTGSTYNIHQSKSPIRASINKIANSTQKYFRNLNSKFDIIKYGYDQAYLERLQNLQEQQIGKIENEISKYREKVFVQNSQRQTNINLSLRENILTKQNQQTQ
ncbi:UNKNOWN [Stylonychia lemnae]|uniref:Uncharacterized protein n=1 Tax=Stylonychia lemnae TaxID=5949 RepID=A0A078ASB3_STYLE|nr:UNKNOWN [Stylonychia lemnae]|eukprot:CDW84112.1 UNKNOWN [Stylonychia lemnae]